MTRQLNVVSSRTKVRSELDAEPRLSWLLRRKVTVPDRTAGYMDRAKLVDRSMPTRNRLTVLLAPGGFGKTTLLAECCRRLCEQGIVTAWISVDPSDDADVLDSYLAFAFQYAGLQLEGVSERDGASESRAGLLARALDARTEPFVLVLDDLHQLKDPGSVALIDFLLKRGPPNLHVAAACRRLPAGLDIGGPVLDGQAHVLGADELRFSKSEINEFFSSRLTRRELVSLAEESAGWPMALRIRRNNSSAAPGMGPARIIVENWVESRLWEGIDADDRELLLDVGLFEWMDAELLDEVLGGNDAMRRLSTMDAVIGFLEPVRGSGPDAWRLHPLIREHCTLQRFRKDRERFREVHRRIAVVLARRGETLLALRHGAESGDAELAGDIVEEAGGIRLWLRYGLVQFRTAIELLDDKVIEARSRLRLARCAALVFAGRLDEARDDYESIAAESKLQPGTQDDATFDRWLDDCILQGILLFYGGGAVGSVEVSQAISDYLKIADCDRADPLVRAYAEHSLCIALNVTAQFRAAIERADRAQARFGSSGYGRMMIEIQRGHAAMAQGRVAAARDSYSTAMRVAKASYLHEPVWAAISGVLIGELDLERYRLAPSSQPPGIPAALTRSGTPFQAYAAASDVAIGRALDESGPERALALLEEMVAFVRGARLTPLARLLAATRVSLLIDAGSLGDAEDSWQSEALPGDARACLTLEAQSWREMEALSSAWLRLLIARRRFDEARGFAAELRAAAGCRGLRRTLMRALALSVVLEEDARHRADADGYFAEFLALFVETDYARPAVLERRSCASVVERFINGVADSPVRAAAQSLLSKMRQADADRILRLSTREREILWRLDGHGDKAIAGELGITIYGVRYHLRNLFSKLGTKTRDETVSRARELGLISEDG